MLKHFTVGHEHPSTWGTKDGPNRAGGAGPVAQAMAGPIFENFQGFSSGHILMQAGDMRACRLQAKCQRCQTNVA